MFPVERNKTCCYFPQFQRLLKNSNTAIFSGLYFCLRTRASPGLSLVQYKFFHARKSSSFFKKQFKISYRKNFMPRFMHILIFDRHETCSSRLRALNESMLRALQYKYHNKTPRYFSTLTEEREELQEVSLILNSVSKAK